MSPVEKTRPARGRPVGLKPSRGRAGLSEAWLAADAAWTALPGQQGAAGGGHMTLEAHDHRGSQQGVVLLEGAGLDVEEHGLVGDVEAVFGLERGVAGQQVVE